MEVNFSDDCDYSVISAGTYALVGPGPNDPAPGQASVSVFLQEKSSGVDAMELQSTFGGTLTVSFVNGKKKVEISNVTFQERGVPQVRTVSFCVVSQT